MKTMNIKLVQKSSTAVEAVSEPYKAIVDRPVETGGSGAGIVGGKYLLIGIGGCFCSTLLAAAQSRNITIENLTVEVTATLAADGPARFTAIQVTVGPMPNVDPLTIERLIAIAEKGCTVINTLKNGVEIKAQLEQ